MGNIRSLDVNLRRPNNDCVDLPTRGRCCGKPTSSNTTTMSSASPDKVEGCLPGTVEGTKIGKSDADELGLDRMDLSEVEKGTECGGSAFNKKRTKTAACEVTVNLIEFFEEEYVEQLRKTKRAKTKKKKKAKLIEFYSEADQEKYTEGHKDSPQDCSSSIELRRKKNAKTKKADTKKKKPRKMTKAEKKAALKERFKKALRNAQDSLVMRMSTPIDFSDFEIPSVDPISQQIEAFNDDGEDKTIRSYIIDDFSCNVLCGKCLDVAMSPMTLACCGGICCFNCLSTNSAVCPLTHCNARVADITYSSATEAKIKSLRIHCPSGCGWYGALNEYQVHSSLHCYQYNSSERIDSLKVKRFDRSQINEEIHNMAFKAKQLQLQEELDIRKSYASSRLIFQCDEIWKIAQEMLKEELDTRKNSGSSQFISQCEQMQKIAQMMDCVSDQIHQDDDEKRILKEQRDKESKAANVILQYKVRPLEGLSNSISTKSSGGGIHQTFDFSSWEQIHKWINCYAVVLFGAISAFKCIDIGAGVLVAVISGAAVNNSMHWVGLEIDPNRLYLGTEIYDIFLNEWQNVSDMILRVGFLESDCTKPLNLRG